MGMGERGFMGVEYGGCVWGLRKEEDDVACGRSMGLDNPIPHARMDGISNMDGSWRERNNNNNNNE